MQRTECRPKLQDKVEISKVAIRGDQSCNKSPTKVTTRTKVATSA